MKSTHMQAINLKFLLSIICVLVCFRGGVLFGTVLEEVDFNWGSCTAEAVSADYDGDGLVDPALYDETVACWSVLLSGSGYAQATVSFGGPGYHPVVGDFDGDGKTDLAVYRETTGEWLASLSGSGYQSTAAILGGPGYSPTPGDYDGDGITEVAVFSAATAEWSIWWHVNPEVTDTNLLAVMYSNAMVNASSVVASKIRHDLTSISEDNTNLIWRTNPDTGVREVLVTSYMSTATATNYYHVGQYTSLRYGESWVTLVPELKNICRNYTGTNLILRLKQVLGLPATSANDTIV
ncbi:MAG: VCBS repeat-containing protein, partial [Kiritimatiellia bacterium]|nr:VCBS repeat-containing protein [Kiritimatiellia bacterium]